MPELDEMAKKLEHMAFQDAEFNKFTDALREYVLPAEERINNGTYKFDAEYLEKAKSRLQAHKEQFPPPIPPVIKPKPIRPLPVDIGESTVWSFLRSNGCFSYSHWFLETFYTFLEAREKETIDYCYIPGWLEDEHFAIQSLELVGVSSDKLINVNTYPDITAKRILSNHNFSCFSPSSDMINLILKNIMKDVVPQDPCKIYISRKDGRIRLSNEDEIITFMTKHGFKSVVLGKMPLSEQIQLFNSASVVVGAHGGGLTNTMFCKPGTPVVEIGRDLADCNTYRDIADSSGMKCFDILYSPDRFSLSMSYVFRFGIGVKFDISNIESLLSSWGFLS